MTELEMFAKLPQLNSNREEDKEGSYLPILSKRVDGKFQLSYESHCILDYLFGFIANTPEEAIRKAYEWCKDNNLIDLSVIHENS